MRVTDAAVLDDDGAMIGSMLVMEATSRDDLQAWLRVEPYLVDDVWREALIHPCQVPAAFRQPLSPPGGSGSSG